MSFPDYVTLHWLPIPACSTDLVPLRFPAIRASHRVCGGDLHPGRCFTEPQGDAIQGRPKAPTGLDTSQATKAHNRDFVHGYCFTGGPSPPNRQQ